LVIIPFLRSGLILFHNGEIFDSTLQFIYIENEYGELSYLVVLPFFGKRVNQYYYQDDHHFNILRQHLVFLRMQLLSCSGYCLRPNHLKLSIKNIEI
jgi:hypothetical protein